MNKLKAKERVEKLKKEIDRHRYLVAVLDRQEISEAALDSLKHELAKLEEAYPDLVTPDSPTQRVAGKPLPGFKKVGHDIPMRSLTDAFSEGEMLEWEARLKKNGISKPNYFAEAKIDGFAISLVYENGRLAAGSTRGDGIVGEDVTQNLKTIDSIPLYLEGTETFAKEREIQRILEHFPRVKKATAKIPERFEIRGEVYMTKKAFEAVNREQERKGLPKFANPRNIAAGSVRQLDPKITAARNLEFLAYAVITNLGQETHEEEHLVAKLFGFRTAEPAKRLNSIKEVVSFWSDILKRREKLPFLIDGVVVQVNSREVFDRLGVAGKAPRGAIAFKFPAEESTTVIENIFVQIGRTGVLTPVAVLKPVQVSGVTVTRATLHNMDEIERLDVRIGDTVIVRRAGDVIPDIVRSIKNLRPEDAKKFRMPKIFCGQPVIKRGTEVAHRIPHPEKCSLVTRERFYHFVSRTAFDIRGLGPKIIDRLIEEGLTETPADLFHLKEGDIVPLERFAEKSAENLIRSIQSRKEISFPRFMYALGIFHVGEETAIDLAKQFGTLEALEKASEEDLVRIANIGEVVARSISEWFNKKENKEFLKKLLHAGVIVKPHHEDRKNLKLSGLTFVLTGGLESMTRDEAKAKVRALGGDISESVGKKTDYVVAGSDAGLKLDTAKKLGVKIIGEKEFIRLLQ